VSAEVQDGGLRRRFGLSMWDFGGLGWGHLARRTMQRAVADAIVGQAAKLAFYLLLSLFPLLLFVIALVGWGMQTHGLPERALDHYVGTMLPDTAASLVQRILEQASRDSGPARVSYTLLFTCWTALLGMRAVVDGLNAAYEVVETRSWWRRLLLAGWLTGVLLALMVAAVALLAYGRLLVGAWAGTLGLDERGLPWVRSLRELLVFTSALAIFNVAYRYAPDVGHRRWHWLMPGTVIGLALWLLMSYGLQTYLRHYDRYAATYGPLGAGIVLLLWFYFSGIVFLVGAEVNAIVEKEVGNLVPPDREARLRR
jgi:membrane protein